MSINALIYYSSSFKPIKNSLNHYHRLKPNATKFILHRHSSASKISSILPLTPSNVNSTFPFSFANP